MGKTFEDHMDELEVALDESVASRPFTSSWVRTIVWSLARRLVGILVQQEEVLGRLRHEFETFRTNVMANIGHIEERAFSRLAALERLVGASELSEDSLRQRVDSHERDLGRLIEQVRELSSRRSVRGPW